MLYPILIYDLLLRPIRMKYTTVKEKEDICSSKKSPFLIFVHKIDHEKIPFSLLKK
tara:strand:+ start:1227 stop:1394 length:168 start_codon:yes stop_codon:yes gene_type:complete